MLTIVGLIIGAISRKADSPIASIVDNYWGQIYPDEILMIFIPPLIFDSAFNTHWSIFKNVFFQVILLAGPMLLVCATLTAAVL